MQIAVLDSNYTLPNPNRGPAGYVVQVADTNILMDCGSGTVQRLAQAGYSPAALDAIFLSHVHIDHVGDLPSLLFALRVAGVERRPLPLHAGPGMQGHVDAMRELYGRWVQPDGVRVEVHEHDAGVFEVGEVLCRVRSVEHHASSLGIRLQAPDGSTMAYLGDTDLCEGALALARNVDVLLVECSFGDEDERDGHMSPRKIAALADAANPEGIILTHLYPQTERIDLAAAIRAHGCDVPVMVAYDGLGIAIDPPD